MIKTDLDYLITTFAGQVRETVCDQDGRLQAFTVVIQAASGP
jgi:hypothetical protein